VHTHNVPAPRKSAEERREEILSVAMTLVAERGFDATPTLAIANAAGISHAYLFRLFPSKEELNVALVARCNAVIRDTFAHAAESARARGEDPGPAMGLAYMELMGSREAILVQLHAHAASPTHPEIRDAMRDAFRSLYALVADASGWTAEEVGGFFAHGMLLNVSLALGLDELDEPWARVFSGADKRAEGDAAAGCGPVAAHSPADVG
jgi:AcrR family transcriptional regulator